MNNENYDFFFVLGVLADLLQIENYEMLMKDASNNDIMKRLQKQDRALAEQTNLYLQQILENQKKIMSLLNQKGE